VIGQLCLWHRCRFVADVVHVPPSIRFCLNSVASKQFLRKAMGINAIDRLKAKKSPEYATTAGLFKEYSQRNIYIFLW
jgi:hypothetical protein